MTDTLAPVVGIGLAEAGGDRKNSLKSGFAFTLKQVAPRGAAKVSAYGRRVGGLRRKQRG